MRTSKDTIRAGLCTTEDTGLERLAFRNCTQARTALYCYLSLRRFRLEEVHSGSLLANIDRGHGFERAEIDYLDCAGFSTHSFNRDKGIRIIRRDNDTMQNLALRRQPGQFAAGFNV